METITCYKCDAKMEVSNLRLPLSESCNKCQYDLHCCKQCEFYEAGKYNDCIEPQAERVVDKEKRNHCDYFKSKTNFDKKDKENSALKKLEDLFK